METNEHGLFAAPGVESYAEPDADSEPDIPEGAMICAGEGDLILLGEAFIENADGGTYHPEHYPEPTPEPEPEPTPEPDEDEAPAPKRRTAASK